ncbi:nuclear transport factor 2 family protein [Sphingomonas sp. AP4-R1]|uniref:nuclear transport factor 2 family protein n=1 Tax=Sphingomonas sp. AP4-R1 TaxID=2735134 RepID=UPI001C0FD5C5
MANHDIALNGDAASGRCYLIDFETASKPDPNPLLLLGIYADQYRRVDGKWLISCTPRYRLEELRTSAHAPQSTQSHQSTGSRGLNAGPAAAGGFPPKASRLWRGRRCKGAATACPASFFR